MGVVGCPSVICFLLQPNEERRRKCRWGRLGRLQLGCRQRLVLARGGQRSVGDDDYGALVHAHEVMYVR